MKNFLLRGWERQRQVLTLQYKPVPKTLGKRAGKDYKSQKIKTFAVGLYLQGSHTSALSIVWLPKQDLYNDID